MTSGENTISRNRPAKRKTSFLPRRKKKLGQEMNKPRNSAPAMVSRNRYSARSVSSAQQRARKPIRIQLAAEGAEIKLPALPHLSIGWRSVSAVALAWLIAMLLFSFSSSSFIVDQLEINGAQRITQQDLSSLLSISGNSVFTLLPEKLEALIMSAYPELDAVSVNVVFPAKVVVSIQERSPVLAWQQSGILVWVDEAGIAFIPQGELGELPIIEALEPPPDLIGDEFHRHQLITPELVRTINNLAAIAPEGVALLYDPELGIGWRDSQGWLAFFGISSGDMQQRMSMYQSILNELSQRNLTPTLISVAHLHAPYYRIDY